MVTEIDHRHGSKTQRASFGEADRTRGEAAPDDEAPLVVVQKVKPGIEDLIRDAEGLRDEGDWFPAEVVKAALQVDCESAKSIGRVVGLGAELNKCLHSEDILHGLLLRHETICCVVDQMADALEDGL